MMYLITKYFGVFFIALIMMFVIPTIHVNAEEPSHSENQISQEDLTDDIMCKDGLELVLNNNGITECVEPKNVLKLVKSGWIHAKTIDLLSISDEKIHEVSENVYAFQFDYCAKVYNKNALGIIISSSIESIPIQIDPNIELNQCHQYGTQIHAFSKTIPKTSLFYEKDMDVLFKNFDKKKTNLEADLVHNQQKLLRLQDPNLDEDNLEEIEKIKKQNKWIRIAIQSYENGLNTLRALQ